MAFYLAKERAKDSVSAYRNYQSYLLSEKDRFPSSAFSLATGEWYFNFRDHRCPHDAWLEELVISEPSKGERQENRSTSIRIRLLGAFHDGFIEFFYPKVFSYEIAQKDSVGGIGDWVYDEFRVTEKGHLIHEIEWSDNGPRADMTRWIIEADDVQFRWIPKDGS